ncbi:MAG: flagellar basal-body MS-ring/collar protein FliF [Rickettsiales bacterium]
MNAMVQSLKELNQLKLAAMIATAVVLIGFFAYLSLRVTAPTLSPLYASMSLEDGAKVAQALEAENIPYEVRANGSQILVPSDQVDKLRIKLAGKGLPTSGSLVGYEIFDKSDTLGTSNFVLNLNQIRALEGELSRTISSLDTVSEARVHLVVPRRELFNRDKVEPTASVAVKLSAAGGLNKNEIAAIRSLVATAVPGLKPQRVTIVDSRGTLLAKGVDDDNDPNVVSAAAEDFRSDFERKTAGRIEQLLEQSVGAGKVKAEVHADIDFDRTVKNTEKYDPEGQVTRSTQTVNENEKSNESQPPTVSAGNNLPPGQAAAPATGGGTASDRKRSEETTNFEISKEVTNSVKEGGNVKKISIAVLVDGTYAADKDGKEVYTPRSDEQIAKIKQLVESAVGYDANRGDNVEVINMQFATAAADMFAADPLEWLKQDMTSIIQTLVLGGVAILAILLVIRPLVARAIESAEIASREDEMEQAALAAPSIAARLTDQSRMKLSGEADDDELDEDGDEMINIDRIQGKLKSSTYSKINSMVEKNPEETVQILRQWLSAT